MQLAWSAGILFLMAEFLGAADLTVDHVSVAGTDLQQMQARLSAIGIPSEFGGPHSNGATQMALTAFPDGSYLELIALQANPDAKAVAAHYWSKQIQGNAGPTAWAVRATDMAAEVARLRTAGIAANAPAHLGRERPDGARLDWETAQVGVEPNGTFFPFLIRDITPREARAFPKGQPTTQNFSGVKHVVIAVRDLKAAVARYRQAYGLPAAVEQDDASFGARLAAFVDTPVILASPLDAGSWIAQRIERFGEGPCAFVLGPRTSGEYKATKTRWFDADKLGWHLGFEE
jgi:catechol 2,3-dioxygenase-like lactoylglutathione lyase family enzyme